MKKLQTVLCVDDDAITLFLFKALVQKTNFAAKVITSKNGSEAIDYLINHLHKEQELPEYIFLDLNMPEMNGWEFLDAFQQLQFANTTPKVIILTSSINIEDKKKAASYSIVEQYIEKPLRANHLLEMVS
ncbi:response regulator [Zhouia sp. PK063]|uniref:response regulator n=1 Tax=Zhouia sp. PK063 TaxID=3373602 RepID=UPI0037B0A7F5